MSIWSSFQNIKCIEYFTREQSLGFFDPASMRDKRLHFDSLRSSLRSLVAGSILNRVLQERYVAPVDRLPSEVF